jgi:RNA polymerase sigma factor (sigma-70 family)
MRATRTNDTDLIVAAQSGNRRALDELVMSYLPLVYTIVGRALGARTDVDDVVQEIMLRAVRQLRMLRDPDNFRPWLAAIAMRHVSTHKQREHVAAERISALDEVGDVPDVDADVEGLTLLRVELSAQRRQAVRASRWLDPDDRALLSLWWLETAGKLTRIDLAAALGVSIAHTGVRVQRMRNQLDLGRSIEAALTARPLCARLGALVAGWDGVPSPLWRKRIARHTRSCTVCARANEGMVAVERLLVGFALLPVPVALTAALLGKSAYSGAAVGATSTTVLSGATGTGASGAGVGILGQLVQAVGAHPVAAAVASSALVVGTAVTATSWPPPAPQEPAVIVAPTSGPAATARPTATLGTSVPTRVPGPPAVASPLATAIGSTVIGPRSLESVNAPGTFVAIAGDLGILEPVDADGGGPVSQRATFEVVRGLADPNCFSFRAPDGRYLRHSSWRVRLSQDEGTALFRGDATFCLRAGSVAGSVRLESSNYTGWFMRHRGDELWVDHSDDSATFHADSSFVIRPPLAG